MRPREGGDGLGGRARWAWRGLQEAEAEQRRGSRGRRRPPAVLTGWAGPGSGRARAASASRPRPRLRRRPSGRGLLAAVGTAAAGCECGPSPRGRAPEGPAWRPLALTPGPGASLDLGPPDASRRSSPCAPRGAPVWLHPCRRFQKRATGTRCELFFLPKRRGPSFPSRDGQCSKQDSRWEWLVLQ